MTLTRFFTHTHTHTQTLTRKQLFGGFGPMQSEANDEAAEGGAAAGTEDDGKEDGFEDVDDDDDDDDQDMADASFTWFNDVFCFDTASGKWAEIAANGTAPSAR